MHEIDNAMRIALNAFTGMVRKDGEPAILHALRVGMDLEPNEYEMAAGILHDVVEDCEEYSLEGLAEEGVDARVIEIVDAMTRWTASATYRVRIAPLYLWVSLPAWSSGRFSMRFRLSRTSAPLTRIASWPAKQTLTR